MAKWVYKFEEGNASMRNLLGGLIVFCIMYRGIPFRYPSPRQMPSEAIL